MADGAADAARARGARHAAHRGGARSSPASSSTTRSIRSRPASASRSPTDKDDDFVGREALAERRAHPQRRLVGLELEGNEPAAHGDCVHVGRHQVGVVTSGTRSPVLKKNIALCRMNVRYAELGHRGRGRQARRPPEADPGDGRPRSRSTTRRRRGHARDRASRRAGRGVRARRASSIVEEGLVPDELLEPLRERYLPPVRRRLRDRDQARRGELGAGPRSRGPHAADLQRLEGRRRGRVARCSRSARAGSRAQLGRLAGRRGSAAGQRALEAAGDEGDRLPPGLVVRRLPRAAGDDHVLDLAARRPPADAGPLEYVRGSHRWPRSPPAAVAVPRAGGLARAGARGGARGRGARRRPGRR